MTEVIDTLRAPHFANGRFFNPWGVTKASFFDVVRWKLLSRNRYGRGRPPRVPVVANDGSALSRPAQSPAATWVGHATFALQDGPDVLLTDPHFGPRALVPRRFHPPGVPLAAIPASAVAVLSHNHYDHLDRFTLARLPKGIAWRVPLGLGTFVRKFGFTDIEELDWWQTCDCRGFRLTLLPAQHWSRRNAAGRFELLADPAHRVSSPLLYRVPEVVACWRAITAQVLWVFAAQTGERMAFVHTPEYRRRLQAIRWLREVTVEGAGHMLHHDRPDEVARLIVEHVAGAPRP